MGEGDFPRKISRLSSDPMSETSRKCCVTEHKMVVSRAGVRFFVPGLETPPAAIDNIRSSLNWFCFFYSISSPPAVYIEKVTEMRTHIRKIVCSSSFTS